MTKKRRRELKLPGNDGRWFLELVGVEAPPPDPTVTLSQLASPDPSALDLVDSTATIGASGGIVLGHGTTSDTGHTVVVSPNGSDSSGYTALPAAPPPAPSPAEEEIERSFDDWVPTEPSKAFLSRRPFRWTVILLAFVLLAAGVAAFVWLPRLEEQKALDEADLHRTAMVDLRNELPDGQLALGILTDTTSSDDAVSTVVPATAELQAKASQVGLLSARPLPSGWPIVPGDPMSELQPTKDQMSFLGASGEQIASRIGRGYVYRTTIPLLLTTPDLPTEVTDSQTINELSVALAASLAASVDLVGSLPADAAFEAIRQAAIAAVERFEDWTVDYLASLRNGNTEATTALIAELDAIRSGLAAEMDGALQTLRREVDQQIIDLAGQTEAAILQMPF